MSRMCCHWHTFVFVYTLIYALQSDIGWKFLFLTEVGGLGSKTRTRYSSSSTGRFVQICLFVFFFCLMWWPIPISNNPICPHLENFAKQRTPNKVICFQGQATGRGFYYRTNKPTIDIGGSNLRENRHVGRLTMTVDPLDSDLFYE